MMKKLKKIKWWQIVIALIIIVVAAVSCGKPAEQPKTEKPVEETKQAETNEIQIFGEVKAKKVYNINVEFPVKIKKILVDTGAIAAENIPVVELDMDQILKEYRDKETELKDSELKKKTNLDYENQIYAKLNQKYEDVKSEYANKTGDILVKATTLLQAKAEYERQKTKFAQIEELYKLSAISKEEYEDAKLANDKIKNAAENAETDYSTFLKTKEREISDLSVNLLEHKKTISDLNNQNYNQQKTDLYNLKKQIYENQFLKGNQLISTVKNGLVEQILTDGAFVEKGAKILNIYDMDTIYVSANLPEEFLNDAKLEGKVRIVPVADKKREYTGTITNIPKIAEKKGEQVQIPIEIKIENGDGYLMPNLNVDVYLK